MHRPEHVNKTSDTMLNRQYTHTHIYMHKPQWRKSREKALFLLACFTDHTSTGTIGTGFPEFHWNTYALQYNVLHGTVPRTVPVYII